MNDVVDTLSRPLPGMDPMAVAVITLSGSVAARYSINFKNSLSKIGSLYFRWIGFDRKKTLDQQLLALDLRPKRRKFIVIGKQDTGLWILEAVKK